MLLNDIGRVPASTLRKINQHLESNYGFKITESMQDTDLIAIMETIQGEITDLKIKGNDAKASPEISKRLLVLEGIKSLREFAVMQFQSPKLEPVIAALANNVVKEFHRSGTNMADFENELRGTMNAYRSSEFRFPDDYVEQRVRQAALSEINANEPSMDGTAGPEEPVIGVNEISNELAKNYLGGAMRDTISGKKDRNPGMQRAMSRMSGTNKPLMPTESTDMWGAEGKRQHSQGGRSPISLDPGQQAEIDRINPSFSLEPQEPKSQVPMVRNPHTGQMQADPFAAKAAERRKGTAMREHTNLVKNLRRLLETEVSQAEVMMAAKGFAQELQEMVEKIGRLQNEDLPPVTDQMRETYGMESASAFQTQIYSALQSVMDALYTAKNQVDDAVGSMATTGQVGAAVDMDKDVGMDDGMGGMDDGMGGMDAELDLDNIGDELGDEAGDEFGGAEGEEPLGRAMKTEAALQRKVMEMQTLVARARKLKEARK